MGRKNRVLAIAAVLAVAASLLFVPSGLAAQPGPARIVYGLGGIPGQDLFVHVAVVVSPGQSDRAALEAALRAQGAKPFDSADFSTTGLVWDDLADGDFKVGDQVEMHYNDALEPVPSKSEFVAAAGIWSAVSGSVFQMEFGLDTSRCPSLVKECPGRQVLDGNNDVAWLSLRDRNTLGVTWYSVSGDETDVAMNTSFTWSGPSGFDILTVAIHEFGHVTGLGHSAVDGAVMEAVYAGTRHVLHFDDEAGLVSLYPQSSGSGGEPPPELEISGLTVAIVGLSPSYSDKDRVVFTVVATDGDGGSVSGADVEVTITTANGRILGASGSTGSNGEAAFSYRVNAKRDGTGVYTVDATAQIGSAENSDTAFFEVTAQNGPQGPQSARPT